MQFGEALLHALNMTLVMTWAIFWPLVLGIVMIVLLGWRFALAEFIGGPIMIAVLVVILRQVMTRDRIEEARRHAEEGVPGRMEGHAAMDMSIPGATWRERLFSKEGFTAISHYYVMDWASVWLDIVIGLVAAGLIGAFVPESVWSAFFLA